MNILKYIYIFMIAPDTVNPGQEWELFRVWDSLVLEDEESTKREWGVRHDGHIEGEMGSKLMFFEVV